MKSRWQAGEGNMAGIIILAVLIVIVLIAPKDNAPESGQKVGWSLNPSNTFTGSSSKAENKSGTISSPTLSTYNNKPIGSYASIGIGNARYSYQPYEEFITIDNRSRAPLNITGWQLRNGKDKRPYNTGGVLQRFSADVAIIPQATVALSPAGANSFQDVVLGEGERAIVVTGKVSVNYPYPVASFKETMCTGYLEALPDYAFTPALSKSCPQPNKEPGLETLDIPCRDFIKSLRSCQTPIFNKIDKEGNLCPNCVNGKLLSSTCAAFVKEHFGYKGCMTYHKNDPKFSGRTWRVFLGRGWEMWNKDYETMELYNEFGQLIDYKNY